MLRQLHNDYIAWSGQFEYLERAKARLQLVVPATLLIIFLLLHLNFGRLTETFIVMLSLPFSLVGGFWMMWWMGFNMSVAVAVGFTALAGVAAETGVIMIIYLQNALVEWKHRAREEEGRNFSKADLHGAIMEGAVDRVRPKMMTVTAIVAGLMPILWSTGYDSEITQRIAVPMVDGTASSAVLKLVVIPTIFGLEGATCEAAYAMRPTYFRQILPEKKAKENEHDQSIYDPAHDAWRNQRPRTRSIVRNHNCRRPSHNCRLS